MQDNKKGTNAIHSLSKEWNHGMGGVTNNKRFIWHVVRFTLLIQRWEITQQVNTVMQMKITGINLENKHKAGILKRI